ncbi:hypothetical protein BGZ63DRAFT_363665 [Mariannaea sp. PMI_226]|nr:hypothetical protein BGZ63DRAFT_363665 [Mariannaea sp. PMI_226]
MAGQVAYPPADWGHGRPRKSSVKEEEDVSGIEKSGLRSMLDKKSDGVRRGLAKTFAFRKKENNDEASQERRGSADRPPSSATVRTGSSSTKDEANKNYERNQRIVPPIQTAPPPIPYQYQQQSLPSPPSPLNPWDTKPMGPPPTSKLPPIPQGPSSSAPIIKRWMGAGRPVARWNKLRKDPELWDPNGDVLIFLGRKGQASKQPPSFRLSSHIIEATESRYLITLLREGSNEEDIYLPPSPAHYGSLRLGPGRSGLLTPPISEDASSRDELDGQISYEMYFPPPANLNRIDQIRHHITTRNVFAILYHASLVGTSLYEALTDLHTRLDSYMPPGIDTVAKIVKYLQVRGIDDVRNDAATAVSLLAWSEGQDVRWEEGWRECFIHCAGMVDGQLENCPDYKFTTPITRALLERANLETQLRVQAAEERLAKFCFSEMWTTTGVALDDPACASAGRLQEMLQAHYASVYGSWPPAPSSSFSSSQHPSPPPSNQGSTQDSDGDTGDGMWLTRTVVMAMEKDFGALYDYLVDRDIIWDVSEARSGRKWLMSSEGRNRGAEADSVDLPMTDILIDFDNKFRFPHIPHPYPLIPESIPPVITHATTKESGGLFKSRRAEAITSSSGPGGNQRSGAMERRVQLAYTESTNIYVLGSDFLQSDLVDAFVRFEKGDRVGEVDPAEARRGRWVVIYGILQTLASVSVDDARVRYKEGVSYHLGPRLKGTKIPPWKRSGRKGGSDGMGTGAHERSYCWTAPQTWGRSQGGSGRSEGGSEFEFDDDDLNDEFLDYFEGSEVMVGSTNGSEVGGPTGRRAKMMFLKPESAMRMGPASVSSGRSGRTRRLVRDGDGDQDGASMRSVSVSGSGGGNGSGRGTAMGYHSNGTRNGTGVGNGIGNGNGNGNGVRGRRSGESFTTAM